MEVINIINEYCNGCEDYNTYNCINECIFNRVKDAIKNIEYPAEQLATYSSCLVCKAKKGRKKEIFYDDGRGGLALAEYCPSCGKKI